MSARHPGHAVAVVLGILIFLAAPIDASAQEGTAKPFDFGSLVEKQATPKPPSVPAPGPCNEVTDEARHACARLQKAAYDHQSWMLEYRQKAFEAHHVYTIIVFAIVCGMVLLGMYLSYKEFAIGAARRQRLIERLVQRFRRPAGGKADDAKAGSDQEQSVEEQAAAATALEIGTSGVKVTSQVLGVIVLVVSMGFFYLYLKTVYPIQESNAPSVAAATSASVGAAEQK
ncbi:MAG: hypothetical protein NTW45_04780 [Rhodocyclales bacterium]|nr:hypothetical protein [Rhodocyclales bacterium]